MFCSLAGLVKALFKQLLTRLAFSDKVLEKTDAVHLHLALQPSRHSSHERHYNCSESLQRFTTGIEVQIVSGPLPRHGDVSIFRKVLKPLMQLLPIIENASGSCCARRPVKVMGVWGKQKEPGRL